MNGLCKFFIFPVAYCSRKDIGYSDAYFREYCDNGDCMRSHVNKTETKNSLSMVTKAGVPANKLIIGMPLYGRSFKMAEEGCWGPDCKYVGPESDAAPGRCTGTRGYISNNEIRQILASGNDVQQHSDDDGDILVYNGTEWVSWLTRSSYNSRVDWITGLNMGGTSDWAIDLDSAYAVGDGPGSPGGPGTGVVYISPDLYEEDDPVVKCDQYPCTFVFPPWRLESPTTIKPSPTTLTYEEYWSTTQYFAAEDTTITTTVGSIGTTIITPSPVTLSSIDVWNHVQEEGDETIIWLTSSVRLEPSTFTKTYEGPNSTSTSNRWRPPITWTWSPGPYPVIPLPTPTGPGSNPDDPSNPSPPPPPPSSYPPSVTFSEGLPTPTCGPGEDCGGFPCTNDCDSSDIGGCSGVCGCLGRCPPGAGNCVGRSCGGGGGSSGGGGGGGGGDGPDDSQTTCSTRQTASWCMERCTVKNFPSTTTTACTEDCTRTFTACSATDSTTSTTTTARCRALTSSPQDLEGIQIVVTSGSNDYTMPPIPTSEPDDDGDDGDGGNPDPDPTDSDPPYPTTPPDPKPYCFRDHNADGRYKAFTFDDFADMVDTICYQPSVDELSPDNTLGFVWGDPGSLQISVIWAENQSGCKPKSPQPMGDYCKQTFIDFGYTCDLDFDQDEWYGGGFVDNYEHGCVVWAIMHDTRQPRSLSARV